MKRKRFKKNEFVNKKTDPEGSYTGTATIGGEKPEQDVDDL